MKERIWLDEARMRYPKQWIVADEVAWEDRKMYGVVVLVTPSRSTAVTKEQELVTNEKHRQTAVIEGFDDTPQVGGLWYG